MLQQHDNIITPVTVKVTTDYLLYFISSEIP